MCSLFAVLKVDGPDVVTVRQVPDVGCVISVLCHGLRVVLSGLMSQASGLCDETSTTHDMQAHCMAVSLRDIM